MDYLSFIAIRQKANPTYPCLDWQDYIILNSTTNVDKALYPLADYEHIHCLLDNDEAGRKATQAIQKEYCWHVRDSSHLYSEYKDKWIGVGGHFEADESPEECLLREVWEETGYTLTSWKYRAIVTFVSGNGVTEYMSLFTADAFTGEPIACNEGELVWVNKEDVVTLNIWEGDKIFFRLLKEERPYFSLKLVYEGDTLKQAVLDGKAL